MYYFRKNSKKNVLYQTNTDADAIIRNLMTIHFIFFVANMFISIPENHMSTGVHQIIGDCKMYDTDLAGHQRQVCNINYYKFFFYQSVLLFFFSIFRSFCAKKNLTRILTLNVQILEILKLKN